ncbi:MAG TPA: hypothetical protein VJA16_19260 [Thermoanaerobaculia bacterium]
MLEEMRSLHRGTIEAVQSMRDELKRDIADLRENTDTRFQVLESAVRQNSADIQELRGDVRQNSAEIRTLQRDVRSLTDKVEQNSTDIRRLDEKVDNPSGLEARVATLERQRG